jgi:hypothetical protein
MFLANGIAVVAIEEQISIVLPQAALARGPGVPGNLQL